MTGVDVDRLVRRYLLLRGLGYLPIGVLVPVLTLLLLERGLSLSTIGAVLAVQGVVVLATELPTGGLADAVGRKPVLLAATVCSVASLALLLAAGDRVGLLVAAVALTGLHRALESGPLDAWFVDRAVDADAATRAEAAMTSAGVVVGAAMAAGSLAAGGLVAWAPLGSELALTVPLVAALTLRVVDLLGVALLMDDPAPGRGRAEVVAGLGAIPATVRAGVRQVRRSPAIGALLVAAGLWGLGSAAYEVLAPVRLAELFGDDPTRAGAWMGPLSAGAWVVLAGGAAASRPLIARLGAARTARWTRVLQGAAIVGLAVATGPVGLAVVYLVVFGAHGATNPAHQILLHREAPGPLRATLLSVNSMAALGAGALGTLVIGAMADRAGTATAMAVGGVVTVLGAAAYRRVARCGASALAPPGDPSGPATSRSPAERSGTSRLVPPGRTVTSRGRETSTEAYPRRP